jgi:non-homologous end joining protein Ku
MIKRKGKEITAPEREYDGAEVVDLMEALRESLDRGGRTSPSRRRTTASRGKQSARSTGTRRKKAS